jgi:hypothetical protein
VWFGYKKQWRKQKLAGHWWLAPVILATKKVEIRRIPVQSQPQGK